LPRGRRSVVKSTKVLQSSIITLPLRHSHTILAFLISLCKKEPIKPRVQPFLSPSIPSLTKNKHNDLQTPPHHLQSLDRQQHHRWFVRTKARHRQCPRNRLSRSPGPDACRLPKLPRPRHPAREIFIPLVSSSRSPPPGLSSSPPLTHTALDLPVVAASDGAGEVIAVGSKVVDFKPGDKVASLFHQGHQAGPLDTKSIKTGLGGALDGVLTQYRVFPETGLVHAPKNLSHEEAATLPCAALTAWNALHGVTPLKAGNAVLVQGSGGVSCFALQVCGENPLGEGKGLISDSLRKRRVHL
jgi:hypothetical protein